MRQHEQATFAGGCFWCMVKPFDEWEGVHSVISGYTGGHLENPTYEDVKADTSGHYEAVEITFDPIIISYEEIVDIFWQQIDPTDDGGQFHDRGESYRTAIFYHNEKQKEIAQASKRKLEQSNRFSKPIVTKIIKATKFYPAEDDHQNFYETNQETYQSDREQSGRDEFINLHWKTNNSYLC